MIIIETKNIPRIKETLIARTTGCVIQSVFQSILDEYLIPVLYHDNDFLHTIFIDLDDILLDLIDKHKLMIIYTTRIVFDKITYHFKSNPVTHFKTKLPKFVFMCNLPDFKFDCDVTFQHSWIKLDNGITHELELIYENDIIVYDTRINGQFLEPGLCKVYKDENISMCLEYIKDGYIKRRFISSIK